MKEVDVFGSEFSYILREVAGMEYLIDVRNKMEIVVSTNKSELKPFKGDVIELHLPKDALVVDLSRRAKLYAKICWVAPSLKDRSLIRRKIKAMAIAHLVHRNKLKQRPKFVAMVQFPNKDIQVNISPFDRLFV